MQTNIIVPLFEKKAIRVPARCTNCGARYTLANSPTTGMLFNECFACHHELVELGTEIKPAGWDRSDPETALRRAYVEVIEPLILVLTAKGFGVGKTSSTHLVWMCEEILRNIRTMPADKIGRWVGFVQGVMAAHDVLDVDAERDRTRPIFAAVYKNAGK